MIECASAAAGAVRRVAGLFGTMGYSAVLCGTMCHAATWDGVHFTSLRSALSGGPPVDRIFEQMADAILDKVSVSPLRALVPLRALEYPCVEYP
jgi:hypothetical protein